VVGHFAFELVVVFAEDWLVEYENSHGFS